MPTGWKSDAWGGHCRDFLGQVNRIQTLYDLAMKVALVHPSTRPSEADLLRAGSPSMKIALVHELLTMRGGAERVLKILSDLFPDAPIYTLLYDEQKLGDWFSNHRVRPSILQNSLTSYFLRLTSSPFNHHFHLRQFPKATEQWDFSEFDLVISTSSAFAHGIITNGKPKHLCIVNSPARYLWDRTHDVIRQASRGPLGLLKRIYLSCLFHKLRIWDSEAADRPDKLLAASKTVQRRIELYWRRTSDVVTPPIDDFWLKTPIPTYAPEGASAGGPVPYFLIVSSLVRYKRIDLAIAACNELKLPLKIVGEGPDTKRLQKLAGPNVAFCGWKSNEQLASLYANATAIIFPGDEDFGLVPLESMACGTPVIAYRSGGALETVIDGETGTFFSEPTTQSLQKALGEFDRARYSREACRAHAKKFSREKFETEILRAVDAIMQS